MPVLVLTVLISLLSPVRPGTNPVGYEVVDSVSVWYPATVPGPEMRYRDYWTDEKELDGFGRFLRGQKISDATVERFFDASMLATRGAPARAGRFPIVFIVQGNGKSPVDQAVLAEVIASHGYVVATIPSVMIRTGPMKSDAEIGQKMKLEAAGIGRALAVVGRRPAADRKRVVLVGYSFGARSALLYSMNSRVRGLVSLDGGIGTGLRPDSMNSVGAFPPLLHIYQDIDERVMPDFRFLQSLRARSLQFERVSGMRHHHFSTIGFAAAAFPEIAAATRAGTSLPASLEAMVGQILAFIRKTA